MNLTMTGLPPAAMTWRRPGIAIVCLLVVVLLLFRETAVGMVQIWSESQTFAHAFLVPPISLWLIWRQRSELLSVAPTPMPLVAVPMAAAAVVWLMGELVSSNAVTQFALVVMLVLCVPLVLGWRSTRTITFPLLYLFFCVPVGEFMLPTLMEWTADFTIAALRLSGVPVFREGLMFSIPTGRWSVIEACSGVRYLIASVMVGTLFAYLNFQSTRRRAAFIGVSIIVPILANWLRAYMIVMLGHLSNNEIATGVDHLVYGWVFFGVVITIMFMIGARWSDVEPWKPSVTPIAVVTMSTSALAVAIGLAVLALTWPAPVLSILNAQVRTHAPALDFRGPLANGWTVAAAPAARWKPRFENPSATWHGAFERQGQWVGVHLLYYRAQGPTRKLVTTANLLMDRIIDADLNPVGSSHLDVQTPNGPTSWLRTRLSASNAPGGQEERNVTILQTYWVDDRLASGAIPAKLYGVLSRLAGRGDDGAVILVYTTGRTGDAVDSQLASFAADNLEALRAALRQTRDSQ